METRNSGKVKSMANEKTPSAGCSRRTFIGSVGIGALGQTCLGANVTGQRVSTRIDSTGSFAFCEGNALRIDVPGLREPVRVAVAGDTHLALRDDRDASYAAACERFYSWGGKPEVFENTLKKIKERNTDLLALVGDIQSFPSLANVEFVSQALKKSGLDWMYVAGNHDWHFEGVPGSDFEQRAEWIGRRLMPLYRGANPMFQSRVVKGVRFVMIDDSTYEITEEQLAFWKDEAAKGEPVVLLMHIPLWTEGWSLFTCGNPNWGAATDPYWKIERRQRWPERQTDTTFAFRDAVLGTPNLVAVITGHIHALLAARERGRLMFSVPCNISGAHFDVRFNPV